MGRLVSSIAGCQLVRNFKLNIPGVLRKIVLKASKSRQQATECWQIEKGSDVK
jgi:hypothetical protein